MPLTPTQKVETIFDSCLRIIYRQRNGTIVTRKKRRPKGLGVGECSWMILCPDHASICEHPNAEREMICSWCGMLLHDAAITPRPSGKVGLCDG